MHQALRGRLRAAAITSVLVCTAIAAPGPPVQAQAQSPTTQPADTIGIVKADESPTNAEIAVRLSEQTPLPDPSTVVIGRDDEFADSLASGVLQATSPLLLVPRSGPVPERVRTELARLDPATVVLLGGVNALEPAVEEELRGLGYAVQRRAGDSRFETATAIARTDASAATTAILARAFPAGGATDPTQGFADALAAGGMAAEMGWPVLLTQTDVLTGATRDYLRDAGITEVKLMGGTAAISQAVEDELAGMGIVTDRLAGASRAETAVEVAKERGAGTAADAAHVLLVQGQTADAWAGGFAAAAHSALLDAPIVLAVETQLPPATTEWLQDGASRGGVAFAVDPSGGGPVLTCVTVPSLCEDARVALGLPPAGAVDPQLVSVGLDELAAGGTDSAVDGSGAVVAFVSDGQVVPDVADGRRHVYVTRYAADGALTTEIADVRPDGTPAESGITHSDGPLDLSADGRYVAFTSPDASLASDGPEAGFLTGGYLRDLQSGTTRLVSFDIDGEPLSKPSDLVVDDDGSVVAYRGQVSGGGGSFGIIVHDLATGDIEAVRLPDGSLFLDSSGVGTPAISGDGGTVAFYTDQQLLPEDTDDGADVYVYDVGQDALEQVSVTSDGAQADSADSNDDGNLGISRDGNLVVFASSASDLDTGDPTFEGRDVFLHDRTTGSTTLLTRLPDGAAADSGRAPAISGDGRYVAFGSSGDLTGSGQGGCGTYRLDRSTDELRRLDLHPVRQSNSCSARIDVGDSGIVVFDTGSAWTDADPGPGLDIYRWAPAGT